MSKQLRIWLFVLLGTLLASSSLLAEGVITMTTTKAVGETISLDIKANGNITVDGGTGPLQIGILEKGYILTSQTITIRGDVTALRCWENQLTSLNLSNCTSLTKLNCRGNQLTSLDLSGCTALRVLTCYDNQLTSLDLSGCTALTSLGCYWNQLTSLDVSGCTALTSLSCFKNQLTSLDVSGYTSLTELDCNENQLTSLNVSGCASLTRLSCGENQLTSLDLSGCTALTTFECARNQLTNLDVSGCTALTSLGCSYNQLTSLDVSGHTSLTGLWCISNQLTSLDVLGCTALETIKCYDNQLTSLDVSGCTNLVSLECHNNQIKAGEMTNLVNSLPDFQGKNRIGYFIVFYDVKSEGNICFVTHVATAQAKGWKVQYTQDFHGSKWYDYTGIPTPLYAVTSSSTGGGSISLTGADDLNAVPYGTTLTVVATPADGYKLTKLTANDKSILDTKKAVVNEDLIIRAVFSKKSFAVKMTKEGEGTLSATGADDLTAVPYGTELTIVATPYEGYELTALTANGTDILASKKVTIKEAVEVKATFTKKSFAVKLTKEGEGTLSATGADDLKAVPYGTELTIVATPNEGYELTALTAKGTDILATKKVVIKGDTEVKATFAKKSFAVTFDKVGEGTITATGASNLNTVAYGTELTIVATPDEGYELTALMANETDILTTKKVTVKEAVEVKATFTKKSFAVTFDKEGEGTLSATGADDLTAVPYGTELTIVATPNEGYELTALTAKGTDILATKKVVIKGDTEVKATFEKKTFAVTLTNNEHGYISIVEPVNLKAVPYGTTLTVKATGKNAQCVLTELTANGEDILATWSFVIKGATEVKATFVDHTGVETTVTQQTQLYPNPATDYVIVEGVAPASEVTLHSMTGERLYAGRADDRGVLQIDLTPYADGVYLVCVAGETYRVVVRR